jgi:hypothetical protein
MQRNSGGSEKVSVFHLEVKLSSNDSIIVFPRTLLM